MEIDSYFSQRRTVRSFTDAEVSDSDIRAMLEAAMHAPTTGNMQLYSVIITRDDEKKKALWPAHFSQPAAVGAKVLLTFCADFNRFVKWCEQSGAVPGFDNFQSFFSAVLDTTIFAQQFVTIAERNGLGTCYLGTTTYNAPDIARVLELPVRVVPVTTVALGVPDGDAVQSPRLPVDAVMHVEKYNDYTREDIASVYAPLESREDSRGFIAENGKQTLAQVFTDVRYPKGNNEVFSKIYRDFIESQCFEV